MSLFVASLNSGSNGNCYYIGTTEDAVLIDGGLSCRETVKRLKRLGLSPRSVRAIFVSHEHGDHIHGVPGLSKKLRIPVYITTSTLANGNIRLDTNQVTSFQPLEPVMVGSLRVTAFPKFHDAIDPHSFVVGSGSVTVGVFTDIGRTCEHVIHHFRQCHAAFLETNYDEMMLENGAYPVGLKNRIRGGHGHLSNRQAAELFQRHRPSFMTHLFLSHLSQNNNRPVLAERAFQEIAGPTRIIVASRHRESRLYHIRNNTKGRPAIAFKASQLQLF